MSIANNGLGVREKDLEKWTCEKQIGFGGVWGGVGVLVGEPKEAMSGASGRGGGQLLQLTKAHLGNEDVYVPG
jgi:hypothetical protein